MRAMRLSEVLLRLGSHLVGWLVIYSHCIWLGVIPQIGCGSESIELFRLSLGFAPLAMIASVLLGFAHRLFSVVAYLKWLAAPLLVLLPLAFRPVIQALRTSAEGVDYCGVAQATVWQQVWGPVQCLTLIVIAVMAIRFVRLPVEPPPT